MAVDSTLTPIAAPGPSEAPLRGNGRGNPDMLYLRVTDYLAICIEGGALAQEAMDAAQRVHDAAVAGQRTLVAFEAGRLSARARDYRARFARWAGEVSE